MFLHLSVILLTGEGGVCLSTCWDTHPLGQVHLPPGSYTSLLGRYSPWAGTPQYPSRYTPPIRYTPWVGTPWQLHPHGQAHPWAGTPPGQVYTLWQVHPQAGIPSWAGTPPGQVYIPRQVQLQAGTPPGQVHLPPLGRYTPHAGTPPWAGTSPRRSLQRTVRILLECFLLVFTARNEVGARLCFYMCV